MREKEMNLRFASILCFCFSFATASAQDVPVDPVFAPSRSSIDRDGIRTAVEKNVHDLHICYKALLKKEPTAAGEIVVNFDIDDKGRAVSIEINSEKSTVKDSAMQSCIVGRIKGWHLPKSPRKQFTTITYPFKFDSKTTTTP